MDTRLFDYSLPRQFIAQRPLEERDHAKLMVLDRPGGNISHDRFFNLGNYLEEGDVLVINKSRVSSCRLYGIKENTGASIECLVLDRVRDTDYNVLLRPYRRLKEGESVFVGKNRFRVIKKYGCGRAMVRFDIPAENIFATDGGVPLPPYIKSRDIDGERYQTVYAEKEGSTASPTAGLHFTRVMMDRLKDMGIIFASLTLDIGPGTFRPVSTGRIEDHRIHEERYEIVGRQADLINRAMESGRRIIAVGTTSARVLETLMQEHGTIREASGFTGLYIYPPYRFRAVDCMVTNFHLPRSTLLVMVAAFAGLENILNAYDEAMKNDYRFYSFGDCMFIR